MSVDLARAARGPMRLTIDEDGETRIKERYVISAPLAGRLQRIMLDSGDPVRADETLLATIEPLDPQLLDPRNRAELEARVSAAKAAVERARARVLANGNRLRARTPGIRARQKTCAQRRDLRAGIRRRGTSIRSGCRGGKVGAVGRARRGVRGAAGRGGLYAQRSRRVARRGQLELPDPFPHRRACPARHPGKCRRSSSPAPSFSRSAIPRTSKSGLMS